MPGIEPELLARLFDQHAPALVLYARQWCETPEDVVQDAFVKLARLRDEPERTLPWLFRVVRNAAINASRNDRNRRRLDARSVPSETWFASDDDRIDAELRHAAAGRAGSGNPRSHHRPLLGWSQVRRNRAAARVFARDCASKIRERADPALRKASGQMDTTGFEPQDGLSEFEEPLASLLPLTGNLSRDRMLFEAGRARALTIYRGRMLMLVTAAAVVCTSLGISLARERSERHALELAFARLEPTRSSQPSDLIPPVSIASNEGSPYSYRALSLLENSSELDEWLPAAGAGKSEGTDPGAATEPVPLRVRDAGKLLQF